MKDHDSAAHAALDHVARVNRLSRDLPLEPRPSGYTTKSIADQALFESQHGGAFTTPNDHLAVSTEAPPRMVNHYRVISVLGRGGMGIVFKAIDPRLNRTLAIKMLLGGVALDPKLTRRFAVEGEALARLEHPNVVPVYEASDWEGVPYYAMKFVPGGTLADNAARLRQDARKAVSVAAKIARAVDYLHQHGVSHRDLKPANILIGENDEPMVADFGLAKFHDADSDLTVPGSLLGTRYYMSPEQTRGQHQSLTPACDLWSVGVILYELLTCTLPFNGASHEDLFREIRLTEPEPIVSSTGEPMTELSAVVRRCLAKNPAARYPNGAALAEDLERWLAGERVQATPPKKPWRRRIAAGAGIAVAACLAAALFAGAVWKEKDPVRVLIGKTADGVEYDEIKESEPVVDQDDKGRFTLEGEDTAFVQLAEISYPQGTRIEADVRQLTATSDDSHAGIYCFGSFQPGPKGRCLNFVGLWSSTLIDEYDVHAITLNFASGSLLTSRWNPALTDLPFMGDGGGLGKPIPLGKKQLSPPHTGQVIKMRMDISPDRKISAYINDNPIKSATLADIHQKYGFITLGDPSTPADENQRFGNGIGLIADACKAMFSNVTVQPLP